MSHDHCHHESCHGHHGEHHTHSAGCCGHEHHGGEASGLTVWLKPAIALAMLAAGIIMSARGVSRFSGPVIPLWYAAAYLIVGFGVVKEAVESAIHGDVFSEFLLMTVASLGAFCIKEYPEAVAVMLFYCIGETLQDKAVDRARDNIKSLIAFRPEWARVDGRQIAPTEVRVGDVIEVRAGERVPLDGVLQEAAADFDTAALTGESVPRTIAKDQEVLAGMVSSDTVVHVRVTRPATESAVSRILNMVEEATERKAPAELFIRKFARIYTPVVCALAVLVVVLPWLVSRVTAFDYVFSEWLERALVFLVISCPCALVISIPLGYFAGIGAASRLGILFKGSNYLDSMAGLETVVFDKTGTLTSGSFAVTATRDLSNEDLQAVAAIEQTSSHPIAQAIVAHAKPTTANVTAFRNIAGYGLSARVDGTLYLAGTLRLLEKHGIAYPADLNDIAETIVAVGRDGAYAGCIVLADTLKSDARCAIAALRDEGIESVILSGDKQPLVDKVAQALGVKAGYGDLLPQDKAERMKNIRGRKAFVGDGINDAPVLALADVGIAMGGMGSDMAIETADVVIQTDRPSLVADAVGIGRATRRVVKQNIAFAIAVKVLIMVLGVMGLANMWAAVFADVGVALLCVLSALRVMGYKSKTSEKE